MLEAIIALPTDMFYNTGISAYVWVLSNKKTKERKGKVQLINGVNLCGKMRKSLGSKRNVMDATDIAENITLVIHAHERVDAIYIYGSRAKQTAHENSDWDIAVLFSDYETDLSSRLLRPQMLEAAIERELKLNNQKSILSKWEKDYERYCL